MSRTVDDPRPTRPTARPRAARALLAAVALLAALGLAGCGEREEDLAATPTSSRLSLLLDYTPNADHAGIYAAESSGALRRAGLALDIRTPQDPSAVLKQVAAGTVDVGITYEPELLLAREQGLDVVAFAALVQRPLTSLISLPRGRVNGVRDLRGKTVATAGIPYQAAYLDTIARRAGVDPASIRKVDVGFNLTPALLSGRADAALGPFWNYEGVDLQRRGRKPRIVRMEQAGVPPYDELVLVARADVLDDKESSIRRLVGALAEGHVAARRNPDGAVDALMRASPDLDRGLQEASLRATLPAFFPEDATKPWGWIDYEQWASYGEWMLRNRLLKRQQPVDSAATLDFLPGQGTGKGRKTPSGEASGPDRRPEGYRGP